MKDICDTVKLNCASAMIISTTTFHLFPRTCYVSREYECMFALSPAWTRRLAEKVEITPERRTKSAVHAKPPVANDLGKTNTRITQ